MDSENHNLNGENPTGIDKSLKKKEDFTKILKNFLKLFAKVYSARILLSLFKFIKSKAYKNFSIMNLMSYIFNLPNLRTSLFVSLLPLLYKGINFFLNCVLKLQNKSLIVFISALLSSFISISIEEKTELMNYVISTIFVRAIHAVAVIFLKEMNILQTTGKFYDFSIFLFSACLAWGVYFLNPRFKPITSLFDKYANYTEKHEIESAISFRDATRLVD